MSDHSTAVVLDTDGLSLSISEDGTGVQLVLICAGCDGEIVAEWDLGQSCDRTVYPLAAILAIAAGHHAGCHE